mmetsp:Transcript_33610/g.77572  ORF Transcript_33610/g.77572 Transcript_33610/m.77572 type:complete len:530 (-) Transcript_33610:105-1694(-)
MGLTRASLSHVRALGRVCWHCKPPPCGSLHRRPIRTGYFTDDADFLDPEGPLLADHENWRWRYMDDPSLQASVLERSNVGMGMLVINRADGFDLRTVNELYRRLRDLEVNSLKRFVGLAAMEPGPFSKGLDPKELLLASVFAQKNGDLASFSKALLWNSQELAYLVADYRKPLVCHISDVAQDGGAALAGLASFSGACHTAEVSVQACRHGLVPMGGMTCLLGSLKWHVGDFLALTGWKLKGADLVALGLVRHWMSPEALPFLELTSEKQLEVSEKDAAYLLQEHSLPLPEDYPLLSGAETDADGFEKFDRSYIPLIEEIFSRETPFQIEEALEKRISDETSPKSLKFLEECLRGMKKINMRAAWITQRLIQRARSQLRQTEASLGPRIRPDVLLEGLRAELWAQIHLLGRQETIWGLHSACTGEVHQFDRNAPLVSEIEEATQPPEDFVFSVPDRPEMPLSQHPRLRRYHPDYDATTGLDHDPAWMEQEIRRWDPRRFEQERREAVKDMLGDRDEAAFGMSRWVRVDS